MKYREGQIAKIEHALIAAGSDYRGPRAGTLYDMGLRKIEASSYSMAAGGVTAGVEQVLPGTYEDRARRLLARGGVNSPSVELVKELADLFEMLGLRGMLAGWIAGPEEEAYLGTDQGAFLRLVRASGEVVVEIAVPAIGEHQRIYAVAVFGGPLSPASRTREGVPQY